MAPDRKPEEGEEAEETAAIETEQEVEEVETEEAVEETETEEETEADAETETEEVAEEAPAKPVSRAQRRIQALSEEVRELRKRVEAPPQRQHDPNAEQERLRREREEEEQVLLTGDVGRIAKFYSDRSQRQVQAQIGQMAGAVFDTADRTAFEGACARNPVLAAVAGEMEGWLAEARAQGLNPKREYLAYLKLGERLAKRAGAAKGRQEKRAGQERQRQQARPSSSRSDVGPGRRAKQDSHEARAKRLDESGNL